MAALPWMLIDLGLHRWVTPQEKEGVTAASQYVPPEL